MERVAALSFLLQPVLRREIAVGQTDDLAAMEHLIQSGPLAPSDLARKLGVTPPTITASVDRLEALGHASRSSNPADRRGIVVTAAPASTARAMGILMPMILDIDSVLDEFDGEQQATITDYLDRVLSTYRNHVPE